MFDAVTDKLYVTEIINDLYRNGFVRGGKAEQMLRDLGKELREQARRKFPASRLRQVHAATAGRENW